ncbi:MAG: type II secretion system protein [Candidatus Electrothrix sp. AX2]|nr:type II secretion system protein [Candidatus Electrothrix gigas]
MNIHSEQKEQKRKKLSGFSVVEILVSVCIIALLASTALVSYQRYLVQAEISYALGSSHTVKHLLLEYYYTIGKWPKDNKQLQDYVENTPGQMWQDWLKDSPIQQIAVNSSGVINAWFGRSSKMSQYVDNPILTLRPVITDGDGLGTIFWLCGNALPPDHAVVLGENRTNIPDELLITNCKRN